MSRAPLIQSKPMQRFRDQLKWTRQHLEFSDASYVIAERAIKDTDEDNRSIKTVLGNGFPDYKALNHRTSYTKKAATFSRRENYRYAIISIHSDFISYMKGVLVEQFLAHPLLVADKAGDAGVFSFREVVECGDYNALSQTITSKVFRHLEAQRSTRKLFRAVLHGTGIKVSEDIAVPAFCYLEMRHLFIHSQGIPDEKYESTYHRVVRCRAGSEIVPTFEMIDDAFARVQRLASHVDEELLVRRLARPSTANMDSSLERLRGARQFES